IAWADAGITDADACLREVGAELLDHGEPIPATIAGYMARALLRDRGQPRGKHSGRAEIAANVWLRNQCVAVMVAVALEEWHPYLRATRNRASHRPSACSVVSEALVRRGVILGERRVEAIYQSLSSLLVQHQAFLSRPLLDPAS